MNERSTHNKLNQSLGSLQSFSQSAQGIHGITDNGQFKVVVYSDAIIRVHITQHDTFDDFTYTVVAEPKETQFDITADEEQIRISTALTNLHIQKSPVRFRFLTKEGDIINEDEPSFGTSWIGTEVTTYKKMQEGERFIGLGEKTGPLDRKGNGYTHWNTDYFAYPTNGDPIYSSIPFYLGVHHKVAYGIYFDNSYQSHFNFGASNDRFSSFGANDGEMNYYFIYDTNVAGILNAYTHLTGRITMPPLWSLGYQQCRYSYYPDHEVKNVARTFRDKNIPADVITLDIHYMDGYKIFTWDKERFPDPKGMIEELKEQGFHVVVIVDPGIKPVEGYWPYEEAEKDGLFVKYPDGQNYTGEVWPGKCHFPDFTNPKAREWWGASFKEYVEEGIEGFWNDMNEIATWGHRLPNLIEFEMEGEKGTAQRARNLYGMQMARSTYEGTRQLMGRRPFILTRSAFAGVQRYSAMWTGDNIAEDDHMLLGVRLLNSLGISGVAYAGYDVGGFAGDASVALFARWISIGAFAPFFRGHSMVNSRDAEPWAFGEEVEDISRNYIELRYNLMPYIYAAFYEASQTGMPVVRTLAIDHTHDDNVYDTRFENQYYFGPGLLVCPIESTKDIAKVYLPEGDWYFFYSGEIYAGQQEHFVDAPKEKLPVFVKASSIIPMQSPIPHTQAPTDGVLQLHVYKGANENTFVYYEDDGDTYTHEEGVFYKRTITYAGNQLTIGAVEGSYPSKFTKIKLVLHGFAGADSINANQTKFELHEEEIQLLKPISSFDPLGKENYADSETVLATVFDNTSDAIQVTVG